MRNVRFKEKLILILLSLFLCVAALEIAMRAAGWAVLALQEQRNRLALKQGGGFRILCLGESTTAWGGKDSYPAQLEEILGKMNLGVRAAVINEGKAAADTARIVSQLKGNLAAYSPNVVVTMMGINDNDSQFITAYTSVPGHALTRYLKQLKVYKLICVLQSHVRRRLRRPGVPAGKEDIFSRPEELFFPLFLNPQKGLPPGFAEGNSRAWQEYEEFMKCFVSQGPQGAIEERLAKAIAAHPDNPWGYLGLGRCWWFQGRRKEAEEMFAKAEEKARHNEWIYFAIIHCYIPLRDYGRCEQLVKKAIEANPASPWGYVGSGWYHSGRGDYAQAEGMFKKAFAIDPANSIAYSLLADSYRSRKMYDKAEELYTKAIAAAPHQPWGYVELGNCYWAEKKYDKIEEVAQRGIAMCERNDRLYGFLAGYYRRAGKRSLAEEYAQKADSLRLQYYNPITRYNYQQVRQILAARGLPLICMQYPLRSVQSLKKMFDSEEGVIFVDNEGLFKDALRGSAYSDYFDDIFAGDFGHCSPKGNRLLAENLARVIVKEFFQ